jgi:hypothetical protein
VLTSVCIVDDAGRIRREVKVASEPEALLTILRNPAYRFKRIGLEAGRRLAVIMHRIWTDGSEFRWTREAAAA